MVVDLHRLRFLREVAARGTMAAAAEALSYTPSAVSQQLAILEKEFGTSLLERRGRNVALTPAGQALVDGSDEVFAAAERVTVAVEAVSGRVAGPVTIGAFQSAGLRLVPTALVSLREEHPELEVHLRQGLNVDLRDLQLGHVDICIDQEYDMLPHKRHVGLDARVLLEEPVFLAVPTGRDAGPDLAAYETFTWAASDDFDECGELLRMTCRVAGYQPDVRFHTDDVEVTLRLVAAGLAVSILPRLAAHDVPDGVALHAVPGTQRRVKALTRPGTTSRPAIALVLDHLCRSGSAASG